jgi:hypothetical protein
LPVSRRQLCNPSQQRQAFAAFRRRIYAIDEIRVPASGCAPFSAILGVGYGVCFGIAEAAFEIALPLVKGSGHQRLPASARQSAVAVLALLLTATRRLMLTAAD